LKVANQLFIYKCISEVSIETEIGFRKNSFIELNRSLLHHYDLETPQVISIDFSTDQPDGIILWQGKVTFLNEILLYT
jgi:hypothetical protein